MSDINVQTFQGKVNISNNLKVGSGHLFVDTLNNQVGLNTNTPLANLHVNGNTYVHNDFRVGSGIVMDQKVATFGTPKTFVVEVVGGVFQIDGVSRPALTFHENQTYIFDQSDGSNNGHPIAFSEAVNGGTPYPTGVTSVGTPGQAGAKTTFKVPVGAPSNLFYYCTQHPTSMGSTSGAPSVVSTEAEVIVSGRLLATSIHGDGSALFNIPSSAINGTLSQWNDVNTNEIYYDLGNVGIGNQNPNSTLDVTGSGAFSTTLSVGGDLTVGTDKLFVDVSTGQVGVGTTTPATGKALDVVGDLQATYLYGDGSNINNITSSQWVTTGNDIYYDTGSVRVGSNQAPTETLDVTGTGAFSDDLTVGASKLVVDVSESRVGINKAAPGYTLDVLGDINFTGDIRKGGVVQTFGGGGGGGGGGVWTEITGTTQIHYSTGNVGIANTDPDHTLSVGSNLYVDDAGSNVLVVDGNVAANQITLGQFEIVPSYGLDDVVNESNTTTNTVHLSNVTTGVITTSNALIGGELTVTGNMVTSSNITVTGNVVVDDDLYLTSNAKLLVDSNTVVEYTGPHGRDPKAMPLKKFPERVKNSISENQSPIGANTFVYRSFTLSSSTTYAFINHNLSNAIDDDEATAWSSHSDYDTSGNPTSIDFPNGHYIQLELPNKIRLKNTMIQSQNNSGFYNSPKNVKIYGSNDGLSWTLIKTATNLPLNGPSLKTTIDVDSTNYYKYHRLEINNIYYVGGTYGRIAEWELYGYEEDPPAGDTSIDTTFTSIMNTPQTTGAQVYVDGSLGETFTNQVTGPTPVGTAAVHDNTNKYWEMNGQLTSNITVEANTFLEGDQPHAVSVWFNSSNLEANVSNTCVFSISDQEKLDSVNLDLQSNTWHNLTYAYQGEGGSRVTYLDGRKVAEDQAEDTFGDYPPFEIGTYSLGGYTVDASYWNTGGAAPYYRLAYNMFNGSASGRVTGFHTDNGNYVLDPADANYDATLMTLTDTSGTPHLGHWVSLELPYKLSPSYCEFEHYGSTYRLKDFVILGSNDDPRIKKTGFTLLFSGQAHVDNNGTNKTIHTFTGSGKFKYLILLTKTLNTGNSTWIINRLQYYGHRENDLVRLPDPTNVLKYPHVVMTGPAQRGYVASASSSSGSSYRPWRAFNDIATSNDVWTTTGGVYNTNTGLYSAGVYSTTVVGHGTAAGEFLQIEFPHKIKPTKFRLSSYPATTGSYRQPRDGVFAGSNNGTDWVLLKSYTNQTSWSSGVYVEIIPDTNTTNSYKYLRLIVTNINTNNDGVCSIHSWQTLGTGVDSVPIQIGGGNIDKVANFRVYDKFVGEDQALEIWDAQKDEFGRAKSSMTLHKGRLGIGTTEPQGRLAVADEPHNLEEFPPRAMTDDKTYIEGHGEFCTNASNIYTSSYAYKAFNKIQSGSGMNLHWSQHDMAGVPTYDNTTGDFTGSTDSRYLTNVDGIIVNGHWIQIEFPYKINYRYSEIQGPDHAAGRQPHTGYIVGSNDLSGMWTSLHNYSGMTRTGVRDFVTYTPPTVSTQTFKYIRLVIEKLGGGDTYAGVSQWRIFGTREQGQSVLHDGQLTLTKSLNVPRIGPALDADDTPRRDRLVVEYNTSTNPTFEGAVRDTSGRGNDGVFVGTASYDATEKAFTFPGTVTNNIYTGNLGPNIKGNQQLTVSLWFKTNVDQDQTLFSILPGDSDETTHKVFQVRTEGDSTNYNLSFIYWSSDYRYNPPALDNPQGKWFHLVAMNVGGTKTQSGTTYDRGDPSNRRLFLNGVELFTPSSTTYGSAVSGLASDLLDLEPNSRLTIGSRYRSNGELPVDGSISNFKLYDTALTAEEVKTLYDMGRLGNVIPKPLHVDTTLQVNGLFQGNSPLQFFVINGVHGASTSNQNVSLPPGLLGSKIVSITGMTFNTNGDGVPFTRHSEAAWEVDVYYSSHGSSPDNQLVLSGRNSAVDDLSWRIFVVTT